MVMFDTHDIFMYGIQCGSPWAPYVKAWRMWTIDGLGNFFWDFYHSKKKKKHLFGIFLDLNGFMGSTKKVEKLGQFLFLVVSIIPGSTI